MTQPGIFAALLKEMRGRFDGWMRDTGDCLRGAVEFVDFPARDTRFAGGPPRTAVRAAKKKNARQS